MLFMAWHNFSLKWVWALINMGKAHACLPKSHLDAVHRVCMPSLVEGGLLSSCKVKLTIDLGVPVLELWT